MKRFTLLAVMALVISVFLVSGASASILCVGNSTGCLSTIQKAVDGANNGDIIIVNPGVYNENVYIPGSKNNIIIRGATLKYYRGKNIIIPVSPDQVIVDARPGFETCSGPAFFIDLANNITITNLTVRHACPGYGNVESGYGADMLPGSNIYSTGDNTKIDKVYSFSAQEAGVEICNKANETVEGSSSTSCQGTAIVQNSYIAGNQGEDALYINSNNATVATNTIINNAGDGMYVKGCNPLINLNGLRHNHGDDCIRLGSNSDNAVITKNIINSCGEKGIIVHDSDDLFISGNTIKGINSYLSMYDFEAGIGISVYSTEYTVISNNTIIGGSGVGIWLTDASNSTITGNTLTEPGLVGICLGNLCENFPQYGPGGTFTKGNFSVSGDYSENGNSYFNTISNNTIEYPAFGGIAAEGAAMKVTGNSVSHPAYFYLDFIDGEQEGPYGAGMPYGGYYIDCYSACNDDCEDSLIDKNTVTNSGWNGFFIVGTNCDITNNTAEHITNDGFFINSSSNNIMTNTARYCGAFTWDPPITTTKNYGAANDAPGIYFGSNGFEISGCQNTTEGNTAEFNAGRGFFFSQSACEINSIKNNISRNNYRTGVRLENVSGILMFDRNLVTDNHGEGIANFGPNNGGTILITNNTAKRNRTDICNEGTATLIGNTCTVAGDDGCNYDLPECDLENPFVLVP